MSSALCRSTPFINTSHSSYLYHSKHPQPEDRPPSLLAWSNLRPLPLRHEHIQFCRLPIAVRSSLTFCVLHHCPTATVWAVQSAPLSPSEACPHSPPLELLLSDQLLRY